MSAANEYRNMIEHSNERRLKALAMPLFERLKERGSDPSPPVASEEQELRERYAKLRRKEKEMTTPRISQAFAGKASPRESAGKE